MAEIRIELRDFTDNVLGNLDITSSDDFPLSLNYQNFDIRDFNSRSGSFSKTFKVPATKNVNKLFNHIYKDGNVDAKNVLKDLPSTIYADHTPIMTGKLRVSQIYKNANVLEYECLFLGDNMDWADSIKNLDLDDLKFSSQPYSSYPPTISADFVFDNPRETFNNVSYSKFHDKLIYPHLTVGEGDLSVNGTLSSDFVPCVFVKNVWDKIFLAQGYNVVSTFCDSTLFENLIMPIIFQKPKEVLDVSFGKVSMSADEILHTYDTYEENVSPTGSFSNLRAIADPSFSTSFNDNDYSLEFVMSSDTLIDEAPIQAGLDTDDYGNAQLGTVHAGGYENGLVVSAQSGGVFRLTGSVTVDVSMVAGIHTPQNGASVTLTGVEEVGIYAKLVKIGTSDDVSDFTTIVESQDYGSTTNGAATFRFLGHSGASGYFEPNQGEFVFEFDHETELNANDKVALVINYAKRRSSPDSDGSYNTVVTLKAKQGSYLQIEQTQSFFNGETFSNLQNYLPKGKQSDFVKGIAQMFNLQFETDPIAKTVYVEPYDYFYESTANAIDWTDKIDYSKVIKDEFLYDIKSKLIFKYKDVSQDSLIEDYNKRNTVDWGSYEETDASGKFVSGEYKVENQYFSSTFCWNEPNYVKNIYLDRSPFIPMYFNGETELIIGANVERPEKHFEIGARILIKGGGLYSSYNGKRMWTHYDADDIDGGNVNLDYSWNKASFCGIDNLKSNITDPNDPDFHSPPFSELYEPTISDGHQAIDYNLSFSDISHSTVLTSLITQNKTGLFYNYYSRMIQQLKQNPRLKVAYINLNKSDVTNLNFRKLIFIDGQYYRLNKIIDFKPHDKQSTKVELQEYLFLGKSLTPESIKLDADNLNI